MNLEKFFQGIKPVELSKVRGKMQEASTRDKKRLLKKVTEIQKIINDLGFEVSVSKK